MKNAEHVELKNPKKAGLSSPSWNFKACLHSLSYSLPSQPLGDVLHLAKQHLPQTGLVTGYGHYYPTQAIVLALFLLLLLLLLLPLLLLLLLLVSGFTPPCLVLEVVPQRQQLMEIPPHQPHQPQDLLCPSLWLASSLACLKPATWSQLERKETIGLSLSATC